MSRSFIGDSLVEDAVIPIVAVPRNRASPSRGKFSSTTVAGSCNEPLRAGDLEPLGALQPHAPANGKEGVGVVESGEHVHGDRSLRH